MPPKREKPVGSVQEPFGDKDKEKKVKPRDPKSILLSDEEFARLEGHLEKPYA